MSQRAIMGVGAQWPRTGTECVSSEIESRIAALESEGSLARPSQATSLEFIEVREFAGLGQGAHSLDHWT